MLTLLAMFIGIGIAIRGTDAPLLGGGGAPDGVIIDRAGNFVILRNGNNVAFRV